MKRLKLSQGLPRAWKVAVFAVCLVFSSSTYAYVGPSMTRLISRTAVPAPSAVTVAPVQSAEATTFDGATRLGAEADYMHSTMRFEPNVGQAGAGVKFISRGGGYTAQLTPTGHTVALSTGSRSSQALTQASVQLRLKKAKVGAQAEGLDPLSGKSNYIVGSDASKWRTDVPNFGRVQFRGIYPGIDLVYSGDQSDFTATYNIAAGARPQAIAMLYKKATASIDADGNLVLRTAGGDVMLTKPRAWQEVSPGTRLMLPAQYVLTGKKIGFQLGAYDAAKPVSVSSSLCYARFVAGAEGDLAKSTANDAAGNTYTTGRTLGFGPSATGASTAKAKRADFDAFVSKVDASGMPVYTTYFGGSGDDFGLGVAIDSLGNAYATGSTTSRNFPVRSALQGSLGGGRDAFVFALNSNGRSALYSTYLGGKGDDAGHGISTDAVGNAYVTGFTASDDFPIRNGILSARAGGADAFVAKIAPGGGSLAYSSFLGGAGDDAGYGISSDALGAAYVTGRTSSDNFPLANAFQTSRRGSQDAFVTKVNPEGTAFSYSSYLGGAGGGQSGYAIRTDRNGNVNVVGVTSSSNFPTTADAMQRTYGGGSSDVFATRLGADGGAVAYSTFIGGSGADAAYGIELDDQGLAYVSGVTSSRNFPPQALVFHRSIGGGSEVFVAKITPQAQNCSVDLEITKLCTSANNSSFIPGTEIIFTLGVHNLDGPAAPPLVIDTITGKVTVISASGSSGTGNPNIKECTIENEVAPDVDRVTCTGSSINAGDLDDEIIIHAIIDQDAQVGDHVTDVATIDVDPDGGGNKCDYNLSNNTSTGEFPNGDPCDIVVTEPQADLSITKECPEEAFIGENTTFTVTVTNNGPDTAANVTVTDVLPTGFTYVLVDEIPDRGCTTLNPGCNIGNLAAGQSIVFTVGVHIATNVEPGEFSNTATVTSTTADPDGGEDPEHSSTCEFDVKEREASITVTKAGCEEGFVAGEDITYTVTVANGGPDQAQNVTVTDILPAGLTYKTVTSNPAQFAVPCHDSLDPGCNIGALEAGASVEFTIVAATDPSIPAGTEIINTASATTTTFEQDTDNNASAPCPNTAEAEADLEMEKTTEDVNVNPGDTIDYTLTVTNHGPSDAQHVEVHDAVPAHTTFDTADIECNEANGLVTCTLDTLAAGASHVFHISVTVNEDASECITNNASVESDTTDPDTGNNSDSVESCIIGTDIDITKTGPSSVTAGDNVTYTISIVNNGPAVAQNVEIHDTLPGEFTFVSCTVTGTTGTIAGTPTCSHVGNAVTVDGIQRLGVGATVTVSVVAHTSCLIPDGTEVCNTATVESETEELDPTDNTSTFCLDVLNPAPVFDNCPEGDPVTIVADQVDECTIGVFASEVVEGITAHDNECDEDVAVTCTVDGVPIGELDFFLCAGTTHEVVCTAVDDAGESATCSFDLFVAFPGIVTYEDDATHDTFCQVVQSNSPLFGFWVYHVQATGEVFCGTADVTTFFAGRSHSTFDHTDPRYGMEAESSNNTGTATVTVVVRATNAEHIIRDSNIFNDPPCPNCAVD